jgi:hypothetical protein
MVTALEVSLLPHRVREGPRCGKLGRIGECMAKLSLVLSGHGRVCAIEFLHLA